MGNCITYMKNCCSTTVGDRDNDGDVDIADGFLFVEDALQGLVQLTAKVLEILDVLEQTGANSEDIKKARDVLNILSTSATASGNIANKAAKIEFPKDLPDLNGDGKIDFKDYMIRNFQIAVEGGMTITEGIRSVVKEMEKAGVDVGINNQALAQVEAVLVAANQMQPTLNLTTAKAASPQPAM